MDAGFWEAAGLPEEAAKARKREANNRLDGPVKEGGDRGGQGMSEGGEGGGEGVRLVNQFPYEACIVMKHHLARTVQQVSRILSSFLLLISLSPRETVSPSLPHLLSPSLLPPGLWPCLPVAAGDLQPGNRARPLCRILPGKTAGCCSQRTGRAVALRGSAPALWWHVSGRCYRQQWHCHVSW